MTTKLIRGCKSPHNTIKMKNFRMKEATSKQEAIISLLDVQSNQPNLLPDNTVLTEDGLNILKFQVVRDLFVKVKTAYYNSQDNSKRF